jgi:hypothetical protein
MPKVTKEQREARSEAFNVVKDRHGFSEYALQKFAEDMRDHSWIGHHLGSHDTQTTSKRAYRSVADWVYKGRGRPRFKHRSQFSSIEGKSNDAVIRLRGNVVLWRGLELPLLLDLRDKTGWERDSLACTTKYVRLVRRMLRGRMRFYAQLVQNGKPPTRGLHRAKKGIGGLDFGPSMVAVVTDKVTALLPLAPSVPKLAKESATIQRLMDRSRRAMNPDNYTATGQPMRGKKWVKSANYLENQAKLADLSRRLAAARACDHGQLSNVLLSLCAVWRTENISYRAFQKMFGRSVARCAPSLLQSSLDRKAESAGGRVEEITTRSTRLSQFDHSTGTYTKKPLSQRTHFFGDGKTQPVQRDLYSAFLARCVVKNQLDIRQVHKAWPGAEPLLQRPVSTLTPIRKRSTRKGRTTGQPVRADRPSKVVHADVSDQLANSASAVRSLVKPSTSLPQTVRPSRRSDGLTRIP